jgi:hypothetical protein
MEVRNLHSIFISKIFKLSVFQEACFQFSLLELWSYNREKIERLSPEDIQKALNETDASPVFGTPQNYTNMLGGIERNQDGLIVSAKTANIMWLVENDVTKGVASNDMGTGDLVRINFHAQVQIG